jgi:hypothetical protein
VLVTAVFVVEVAERLLWQAERFRRHALVAASLLGCGTFAHGDGRIDRGLAVFLRDGEGLTPQIELHLNAARVGIGVLGRRALLLLLLGAAAAIAAAATAVAAIGTPACASA